MGVISSEVSSICIWPCRVTISGSEYGKKSIFPDFRRISESDMSGLVYNIVASGSARLSGSLRQERVPA